MAKVHGQENVLTPEQRRGRGGNTINVSIHGATDTAETERAIRHALIDALGVA